MKRWMILGAVVCLLLATAGFAQTTWLEKARIDVPHSFVVGKATLPAGSYLVSENTSTHQLLFRNMEDGSGVYASTQDVDISKDRNISVEKAKAVFVRDADGRQVLHQIWISGDYHANDLRHEKGIAEPH